jgi:hypothetical protein
VEVLASVLADPELDLEEAPGEGWAPVHAAVLLGELGGAVALRALVEAFSRDELGEALFETLAEELEEQGGRAAPHLLLTLEHTPDGEGRGNLLCALTHTGVKDGRVLGHLLGWLRFQPERAAGHLEEYGDPAAVGPLLEAFDRPVPGGGESWPGGARSAIARAVEALGGSLGTERRAQVPDAGGLLHALVERMLPALELELAGPAPARRVERPGRNAPCWCGSGKKYKKCHADEDAHGGLH